SALSAKGPLQGNTGEVIPRLACPRVRTPPAPQGFAPRQGGPAAPQNGAPREEGQPEPGEEARA
ncbi:hypothetical protein ABZ203_07240, partial [Streptomyces albidoflavus]